MSMWQIMLNSDVKTYIDYIQGIATVIILSVLSRRAGLTIRSLLRYDPVRAND